MPTAVIKSDVKSQLTSVNITSIYVYVQRVDHTVQQLGFMCAAMKSLELETLHGHFKPKQLLLHSTC